jgi:hypothetical protein
MFFKNKMLKIRYQHFYYGKETLKQKVNVIEDI